MTENSTVPTREFTMQYLAVAFCKKHGACYNRASPVHSILNESKAPEFIEYLNEHIHTLLYESSKHVFTNELKRMLKATVKEQQRQINMEKQFIKKYGEKYGIEYKP